MLFKSNVYITLNCVQLRYVEKENHIFKFCIIVLVNVIKIR